MTQEEKARAYDVAIRKVKDMLSYKEVRQEDMEYLFPELAESEDERARKEILNVFKQLDEGTTICGRNYDYAKWISWIEKQSNTIPDECVFRPVAGCNIESAAKQAIKQQGVLAKKIVLAFNGAYIPVGGKAADIVVNEYESWLEKQGQKKCIDDLTQQEAMDIAVAKCFEQGEQKLPKEMKTIGESLGFTTQEECDEYNQMISDLIMSDGNKGEQKPQRMISAEAKEALYDKPATIDIDKMVDDYANNKELNNKDFGFPLNCMIRAYRQGLKDAIGKIQMNYAKNE